MKVAQIFFAVVAVILLWPTRVRAVVFDTENPFELVKVSRDGKTAYDIRCNYQDSLSESERNEVRSPANWKVIGTRSNYEVLSAGLGLGNSKQCVLKGNWPSDDDLSVSFENSAIYKVKKGDVGNWSFGQGQPPDISIRRLTDERSLYAVDYSIVLQPIQLTCSRFGTNVWIRTLGLSLMSEGTIGSSDSIRNGTQTSFSFEVTPFYRVDGIMYRGSISVGYGIETKAGPGEPSFLTVLNKRAALGVDVEVPLSNYPMFKLHSATKYARLAMPLTLRFNFLPRGTDGAGNITLTRFDFKAAYELAFSPYFILQSKYHTSHFRGDLASGLHNATYSSFSIAQDLDVVKRSLGFLKLILGSDDEIANKSFIYFRISSGRDSPTFQNVHEKSIGLGTTF